MRCGACGTVNERGRAYCGYCAHSLGSFCPVCQFFNGESIRYCGGCARDLLVAVAETLPVAAAVPVSPAIPAVVPTAGAVRELPTSAPSTAFDDLEDLCCRPASAAGGAPPLQPAAADTTQDEIDGFFQRLVREGDAQVRSLSVSAQPPGPPGSASS